MFKHGAAAFFLYRFQNGRFLPREMQFGMPPAGAADADSFRGIDVELVVEIKLPFE